MYLNTKNWMDLVWSYYYFFSPGLNSNKKLIQAHFLFFFSFFFFENPWVCYLCNLLGLPWAWLYYNFFFFRIYFFFFFFLASKLNKFFFFFNLRVFLILWLRVFPIQSKFKKKNRFFLRVGTPWVARGVTTGCKVKKYSGKEGREKKVMKRKKVRERKRGGCGF